MRLWVRAAASPTTGLGHLLREVAIAERAASRGIPATFVVDDVALATSALGRFGALGAAVTAADAPWLDQVARDDVVIFDGYGFGPPDHAAARRTACLVAVVDDRGTGRFEVDVLCDHNPLSVAYELPAGAVLLHGLRYALVREEFLGGRRPRPTTHDHLLLAFGGTDAAGLLPHAIDALANREHFSRVTALVGPGGAPPRGQLPSGIALAVAPRDVAAVHAAADAALITVGTTLWELLVRGMPTAAISLDPLHRRAIAAVAGEGAVLDAGSPDDWVDALPATLARLADPDTRRALGENARRLVDGRGPDRVLDQLLERRSIS